MAGKHRLRTDRTKADDDTDRFHAVDPNLAPEAAPIDPAAHLRKGGKPFVGIKLTGNKEESDGKP
jgi:hypothetical protein